MCEICEMTDEAVDHVLTSGMHSLQLLSANPMTPNTMREPLMECAKTFDPNGMSRTWKERRLHEFDVMFDIILERIAVFSASNRSMWN